MENNDVKRHKKTQESGKYNKKETGIYVIRYSGLA